MEQPNAIKGFLELYWQMGSDGYDWVFNELPNKTSLRMAHTLKNGDHLTIFDKQDPQKIVWDGEIRLIPHEIFTEPVNSIQRCTHADQEGVECDVWKKFFWEEYPATLISANQ